MKFSNYGEAWTGFLILSLWGRVRRAAFWPSGFRPMAGSACWCLRRAARIGASLSKCHWAMARHSMTLRELDVCGGSRSGPQWPSGLTGRAARCWADQARSMPWFISAVPARITKAGKRRATRAGAGQMCCAATAPWKTLKRVPMNFAGRAGRCLSAAARRIFTRSTGHLSKHQMLRVCPIIRTSMAQPWKALEIIRSQPKTAGACPPRGHFCGQR